MIIIFSIFLSNLEINYACIDQHVDAKFKTYKEAYSYAEYFKPHHHYKIIPYIDKKNLD